MRLIIYICTLFALATIPACASLGAQQERMKTEARARVASCFARRGIVANSELLDTVPVRFVWWAQPTCGGNLACFNDGREIVVSTYGNEDWLPNVMVEKMLRHEYVHALLHISGLPQVPENPMRPFDKAPLMEDCEK